MQLRMWCTTTALSLWPGRTQVTMFGGCPKYELGKSVDALPKLAKTTLLEFGEQNTWYWLPSTAGYCTFQVCNSYRSEVNMTVFTWLINGFMATKTDRHVSWNLINHRYIQFPSDNLPAKHSTTSFLWMSTVCCMSYCIRDEWFGYHVPQME